VKYCYVTAFLGSELFSFESLLQAVVLPQKEVKMVEITYTRMGDYLIPDIILKESSADTVPLGLYGQLRQRYLKTHRPILYSKMLLTETLYPHLREIDKAANHRLSIIKDREQARESINEILYE